MISTAAELKNTDSGIAINAGSLGSFTLSYPEFEPEHKQTQVKVTGVNAVVKYEGGGECAVVIDKDEINLVFKGISADVKSWKMSMLIDIGFAKGGTWKMGENQGKFPAEKAKPPQISGLSSTSFLLKNAQGQSLQINTPEYEFQ